MNESCQKVGYQSFVRLADRMINYGVTGIIVLHKCIRVTTRVYTLKLRVGSLKSNQFNSIITH